MNEAAIEQKSKEAGLTAPRLTPEALDAEIESVAYENARREMRPLLGYALKASLHKATTK